MRPINVVLAHHDPQSAAHLLARLRTEFRKVVLVNSADELRYAVARLRAALALVDLELMSYRDIRELSRDFPAAGVVSIHRLADERMWSESLAYGAADCCQSNDVASILHAADRYTTQARAAAAAA